MPQINVARVVEIGKPLEVGKVEKPVPGPKEVLVKVEACSLVPNSKALVSGKAAESPLLPDRPFIFGLDAAGVIEAIGDHVLNLKVGDRVYVDPYLTCETCHLCRSERKDLCPNNCFRGYFYIRPGGKQLLGRYPIGGLSEYVISPDANIGVLPPSIDVSTASRFGYLGTSFGGLKKGKIGPGKTLVINGATGTLGYAAVAIGLGLGCTKILGIGRNRERLAEVKGLSKNGRVAVRSSEDGGILEWVKEQTGGKGPDAIYDCLGVGGDSRSLTELLGVLKPGGIAVLAAGSAPTTIPIEYSNAMQRDTYIHGTMWFTPKELDEMINLIDAGVIDISFLQNKFFPLSKVNDAFEFVGDRPGGATNVVVQPHIFE